MLERSFAFAKAIGSNDAIRFGLMIVAIGVSIYWNFRNWQRTNKLDSLTKKNAAAIRFEAVHGDSIGKIITSLDEIAEQTNELSTSAVDLEQCKIDFNDKIKSLIVNVEYKVVILAKDIQDSPLVGEVGEAGVWKSISVDGCWDETWSAYSKFSSASGLRALVSHLSDISDAVLKQRSNIVSARANENNIKS